MYILCMVLTRKCNILIFIIQKHQSCNFCVNPEINVVLVNREEYQLSDCKEIPSLHLNLVKLEFHCNRNVFTWAVAATVGQMVVTMVVTREFRQLWFSGCDHDQSTKLFSLSVGSFAYTVFECHAWCFYYCFCPLDVWSCIYLNLRHLWFSGCDHDQSTKLFSLSVGSFAYTVFECHAWCFYYCFCPLDVWSCIYLNLRHLWFSDCDHDQSTKLLSPSVASFVCIVSE